MGIIDIDCTHAETGFYSRWVEIKAEMPGINE
jgi:hypothetical protein